MRHFITFLVLLSSISAVFAQYNWESPDAQKYANSITAEGIKEHLMVLASDEYEGRETGEEGQRKAEAYLSNYFKSLGLPPKVNGEYTQDIIFNTRYWNQLEVWVKDKAYLKNINFYALPSTNPIQSSIETNKVYYLGYGIDEKGYSEYARANVKGKVVMINSGEPMNDDGTYVLTGTTTPSDWSTDITKKYLAAKKHGALAILVIDPNLKKNIADNRLELVGHRMVLATSPVEVTELYPTNIHIGGEVAKAIMGSKASKVISCRDAIPSKIKRNKKIKPVKLKTKLELDLDLYAHSLKGSNVIGYIEGTDPMLKDEIVMITAHYDHLGIKGKDIFNGADDNGSGTSTVLEIAQAFTQAKKEGKGPRRTVVTMLVSGEEKGLLGSEYYTQYPIFPLENTIVDVNVDMIGRVDNEHLDNENYVYVIGADRLSTTLHDINEAANNNFTKLELDYTFNDENDPNRFYYRSDHYNFAKNNIPAIFFFSGVHEDYHQPTDTPDKILYDKTAKIGQLVFYTAWELANRNDRIEVNVKGKN